MLEPHEANGFNGDTRSMNLTFGHVHTAHHILVSSGGNEVVTRCPYWKVWTEPSQGIRQKGLYFFKMGIGGSPVSVILLATPTFGRKWTTPPKSSSFEFCEPPPQKTKNCKFSQVAMPYKKGVFCVDPLNTCDGQPPPKICHFLNSNTKKVSKSEKTTKKACSESNNSHVTTPPPTVRIAWVQCSPQF